MLKPSTFWTFPCSWSEIMGSFIWHCQIEFLIYFLWGKYQISYFYELIRSMIISTYPISWFLFCFFSAARNCPNAMINLVQILSHAFNWTNRNTRVCRREMENHLYVSAIAVKLEVWKIFFFFVCWACRKIRAEKLILSS